jgi:hypothetical protein
MVTEVEKEIWDLARAKTVIDTEGRMPSQRAGDADDRQCGQWIANNKKREKGPKSDCKQLMRREIPLAFASSQVQSDMDKWIDNLARAKTFIDTEERMPSQIAGDADERQRGQWIANNKKRKKEPTANVKS